MRKESQAKKKNIYGSFIKKKKFLEIQYQMKQGNAKSVWEIII